MYSMFDLFFNTPAYRHVYIISNSEKNKLQRSQHQDELKEIRHQKKRLDEAYKARIKHLDEREKELKTKLKAIGLAKKKSLDFNFFSEREFILPFFHLDQTSSVLLKLCEISFPYISLASSNLNTSLL